MAEDDDLQIQDNADKKKDNILRDENGVEYEIDKVLCYKILNNQVKINGEKFSIKDTDCQEMEIPVSARIKVLALTNGELIVAIQDDIWHKFPVVFKPVSKEYIYVTFVDCVEYFKRYGYKEMFSSSKYDKMYETNERLSVVKLNKWWKNEKFKRCANAKNPRDERPQGQS